MPYKAVIFDLFGTLIDENPVEYRAMMERMAKLLGVSIERLYEVSFADVDNRDTGVYQSVQHQFDVMCTNLGVSPSPEHLGAAIEEYVDLQRSRLVPRDGVLDTLSEIAARGMKRGLISNASQVIAEHWPATTIYPHMDASVLSVEARIKKPDPAIYLIACNQLGVAPEECLYVGDGGANELTGAASVGMTSVLIEAPYHDAPALGATRQAWDGARITSIPEVLGLL